MINLTIAYLRRKRQEFEERKKGSLQQTAQHTVGVRRLVASPNKLARWINPSDPLLFEPSFFPTLRHGLGPSLLTLFLFGTGIVSRQTGFMLRNSPTKGLPTRGTFPIPPLSSMVGIDMTWDGGTQRACCCKSEMEEWKKKKKEKVPLRIRFLPLVPLNARHRYTDSIVLLGRPAGINGTNNQSLNQRAPSRLPFREFPIRGGMYCLAFIPKCTQPFCCC